MESLGRDVLCWTERVVALLMLKALVPDAPLSRSQRSATCPLVHRYSSEQPRSDKACRCSTQALKMEKKTGAQWIWNLELKDQLMCNAGATPPNGLRVSVPQKPDAEAASNAAANGVGSPQPMSPAKAVDGTSGRGRGRGGRDLGGRRGRPPGSFSRGRGRSRARGRPPSAGENTRIAWLQLE